MNPKLAVGGVAASLVAVSSVIYIIDIVRGGTRPHRVSWAVWTLIGLLGAVGTLQAGSGAGAYVPLEYLGVCACVFILSLLPRYGKQGGRAYDLPLGVGAAATLVAWKVANWPPSIAVGIAISADSCVTWMTLRDGWADPSSESLLAWWIGACGAIVGAGATQHLTFAAFAYPCYLAIASTAMAGSLLFQSRRQVTS
jgi:hypothetical protein